MANASVTALTIAALLTTSSVTPVMAQTRPAPVDGPQILPVRPAPPTRPSPPTTGPSVQPPRPPYPGGPGGPAIQPPRPYPGGPGGPAIQPPRPPRPPYPGEPGGPAIQPPRPYPGGPAIVFPGNGYTLRCESFRNQRQRCAADTESRVQLVRRLGGACTQGRTWGYDRRSIWVDRGCRAEFSYGRWAGGGGHYPQPDRDKGPSTGAVIAGVVVAGGLIALLANSANRKPAQGAATTREPPAPATFPAGPPAALVADLAPLPSAARPSVQTCLYEAARQIGATGGTRLSYDRLVSLEQGNGGWRFGASLTATYPDGDRVLPFYCRATPTKVIQIDFANG